MTSFKHKNHALKRTTLALVLGASISGAFAQSTTGSLFGQAPAADGTTVTVQNESGLQRTVTVDANGRYNLGTLPVGKYTVKLERNGRVIEQRQDVLLRVGTGTEVSFRAQGTTTLDAVTVTAANVPKIDVSTSVAKSVITSEQLDVLPLGRTAEAIAMLAPGVIAGSSAFGNGSRSVLSFGGSSVSENAYYLNGFNVSNPYNALGGASLPYGSIDQQETYTGGYSSRYGRSTGGVLNQLGKRGTNEWHFGFQTTWSPKSLAASPRDVWYPNDTLPPGSEYVDPSRPGTLYRSRDDDTSSSTTYSGYVSGPLIEDRLFVHLAAESNKREGASTNSISSTTQARNNYTISTPKFYGKIDWNITDNHTLEYTRFQNNDRSSGYYTAFDYEGLQSGERTGTYSDITKLEDEYDIFKYTGYLTDDLTLSAVWGRSEQKNLQYNPLESDDPYLSGVTLQDPAITGGTPIRNGQAARDTKARDAGSKTRGLRVDLDYRIGNHQLTAGIDNMYYNGHNEGQTITGPGYAWYYSRIAPGQSPSPGFNITPPGGDGYYVYKYIFSTTTSMAVEQKAYYLEDRWQVTPRWLLTLGIRNDKFTNFNSAAQPYVESGDQWAPRLGASWDVFGDASFKVFANLGRYYLALPNSVAVRGASASTFTREYFTYTGIDANGNPTGLTALGPGPVSTNNEYGQTPDPANIAPTDLKSQYQDELILGFEKTIGQSWNSGAKFTYRRLQSAIDDVCDPDRMLAKLQSTGVDTSGLEVPGCVIFNPGKTNTFLATHTDGSGYTAFQMSASDWGFGNNEARRDYVAVDLFIEHPLRNKWYGRLDYTWSRSFGNTEGQVKSDIGQDDISKTQDWDSALLMEYSGGYLANDRRHQLKGYGAYQFNDEWTASATLRVMSGAPKNCLGYYGPEHEDPIDYGSSYHYCDGVPSKPGDAGRQPWTKQIDLGVIYRPAFADHKLAFGLDVFNVLNELKPIQSDAVYESDPYTISNSYDMETYFTTPRSVRLTASYDF
ncbi:TonB-dependent receptor [Stenotrophomonas sp. SY1]|uniref:TonB-dependent receptor n=1 Tax=Stenotrophomonas sp. SY1 TaxID=477235 RepID=UPI001E5F526E|nr:TonB-dependent receptor [Stenotrophomonas sp. SY1]MCD9085728.1 TonB-dependent receptor [Stenotrophomonas sp. SY1]